METKKCAKCGEEKSANNEYFAKKANSKDGLQSYCRICNKKYKKEYYADPVNKERNNKIMEENYLNNKEERLLYQKNYNDNHKLQMRIYRKKLTLSNGIFKNCHNDREILIENWLHDNNIPFIKEFEFHNCISVAGNHLSFDYYIVSTETFIEEDLSPNHIYDKDTIVNDNLKNEYCISIDNTLIRILKNDDIESKLQNMRLQHIIIKYQHPDLYKSRIDKYEGLYEPVDDNRSLEEIENEIEYLELKNNLNK